jgi:hypothetical protein
MVVAVVAGFSWYGVRERATPTPEFTVPAGPTAVPSYSSPTDEPDARRQTLSINPLAGVPKPDNAYIVGVWSGVAVFDLAYHSTRVDGLTTDILRGVDITTGETLWTYDALPDGAAFHYASGGSGAASGGYLALALPREGDVSPETSQYCIGGTYLLRLAIATGKVADLTFLDAGCTAGASRTERVVAYQDGIIVVEQGHGTTTPEGLTVMVAYADTDLETPLWTVPPAGGSASAEWWPCSSPVIAPGWVATPTGGYVALPDGRSANAAFPHPGMATPRAVQAAGGNAIELIGSLDPVSGLVNPWVDEVAAWSDPDASVPRWTYTPEPGWVLQAPVPWGAGPFVAVATDVLVVMEVRYDGSAVAAARLTALDQKDGSVRWSVPYEVRPAALSPATTYGRGDTFTVSIDDESGSVTVVNSVASDSGAAGGSPGAGPYQVLNPVSGGTVWAGGRELVWYDAGGKVDVVEAATGQTWAAVSATDVAAVAGLTLYQCGADRACLLVTSDARARILTVGLLEPAVVGTDQVPLMDSLPAGHPLFPVENGLIGVSTYPDFAFVRFG